VVSVFPDELVHTRACGAAEAAARWWQMFAKRSESSVTGGRIRPCHLSIGND
jgi:hypothetical protein